MVMGASRFGAALLGLLAATLIAQHLSPSELGVWSMALAIQGFVLHAGEFGLRSVVTAEASAAKGGPLALLERYLGLRLVLSTSAIIIATLGAHLFVSDQTNLVLIVSLSVVAIALMVDWVPLVEGRIRTASLLLLARPAFFCFGLLLLPSEAHAEQIAILFLLAWIGAAAASWLCVGTMAPSSTSSSPPELPNRKMLSLGWPLMGVTLTNQALMSGDLLIVGSILGSDAAGIYYLASAMAVAGLVFANAAGQLALVRLGRWRGQPSAWRSELLKELGVSLTVACFVALLLLTAAPLAVVQLFGERYRDVAAILPWFIPWLVLQHAGSVLQAGITALRARRCLFEANLGALIVQGTAVAGVLIAFEPTEALTAILPFIALTRALAEAVKVILLWQAAGRLTDPQLAAGSA